jgi:tetratricopeptide (TPR) repeat protein
LQKALSKQPLDRYLSVEQFSDDLRRYLEGRPVRARGDHAAYRFGKFVRKNAAMLAISVIALAALVAVGISATLVARRTEAQLQASQQRENQMRADHVQTLLALGELDQRAGNARAREDFAEVLKGPLGDSQIAEASRGLGIAEFRAGDRLDALAAFTQSLMAADRWLAREHNNPEAYTAVANANYLMGQVLAANGETGAAIPKLRKAFDLYRDLAGSLVASPVDQKPDSLQAAIQQIAKAAPPRLASKMAASSLSTPAR